MPPALIHFVNPKGEILCGAISKDGSPLPATTEEKEVSCGWCIWRLEPELPGFRLAQALCEPGGWSESPPPTPEEIEAAQKRWAKRSYSTAVRDPNDPQYIPQQCGGCKFFAATGADYGICWNEQSPQDGCICFEHGGCAFHSQLTQEKK